jgi:hypothetical protein
MEKVGLSTLYEELVNQYETRKLRDKNIRYEYDEHIALLAIIQDTTGHINCLQFSVIGITRTVNIFYNEELPRIASIPLSSLVPQRVPLFVSKVLDLFLQKNSGVTPTITITEKDLLETLGIK